MPSSSGQVN